MLYIEHTTITTTAGASMIVVEATARFYHLLLPPTYDWPDLNRGYV